MSKQGAVQHVHGLRTGQLVVERRLVRSGAVGNWEGGQPGILCAISLTCGHDCLKSKNTEAEKLSKAMPEESAQLRSVSRKKNNFEAEDRVSGEELPLWWRGDVLGTQSKHHRKNR